MKSPLLIFIFLLATLLMGAAFILSAKTTNAAGVNLIPNPGFEEAEATDPTRPAYWHANSWGGIQASFVYPAPGISNTSAVSVTVSSTQGTGDAKWFFDDIPVDADQTYVFGTHYRADVATEIDARYLLSDGTYSYAYIATVPASNSWSQATYTFTVPSNAVSLTIFHVITLPGSLSFDDVSLEAEAVTPPPPPTPTSTASLIANFDLESANNSLPSGWSQGGWGTNSVNFEYPVSDNTGGNAVRVNVTSWTSGDAKWVHPAVSITGGETYKFNDDYRSDIASNITLQYKLNDGSYSYAWVADLPAVSGWTKTTTYTFTAPTNATELTVFHLINNVGFLETDNYTLTPDQVTPPPPPPPPDPTNLIINGDMDTADSNDPNYPQGWDYDYWGNLNANFIYPVADSAAGIAASRVEINSYSSGDAKWIHAPVAVTPNTTYTFSDDYRSNLDTEITIQYKLTDGSLSYAWVNAPPASTDWTHAAYVITTPVNAVEATIFHLIAGIGWLETDNFKLVAQDSLAFNEPMITFVFDDGTSSIYNNAVPIIDAAGIKSTQAIISDYLTYDGYMNLNQILELKNNGHEIASHTKTHAHLTQLDQAGLQDEILGSKDDLEALGLGPVNTLVYPYGEYNSTVTDFVRNSGYYIGARSVDEGYNYTNTDPFVLMDQHVDLTTTAQQIKDDIDLAITNKSWIILEFHDVNHGGDPYSTTPEVLQEIVNYVKSTGIRTVTLSEGSQILNQ